MFWKNKIPRLEYRYFSIDIRYEILWTIKYAFISRSIRLIHSSLKENWFSINGCYKWKIVEPPYTSLRSYILFKCTKQLLTKIFDYALHFSPILMTLYLWYNYFIHVFCVLKCLFQDMRVSAGAYLRKIAHMASTKIAFYMYYLLIISPGSHVYVYYMVFAKLLQENY